jgi:hypothetical protein
LEETENSLFHVQEYYRMQKEEDEFSEVEGRKQFIALIGSSKCDPPKEMAGTSAFNLCSSFPPPPLLLLLRSLSL